MAEQDVIDLTIFNALLDSVGGDREFLAELLQTYFDDSPRLIEAMRAAQASGSADDLRRAAHSLKSNSKTFGAIPLSDLAKRLEEMAKSGRLEGAGAGIAQAEAEYARVKAALQGLAG